MIKYNDNTINKWYHDGELIKVYYHDAVCYYKLTPSGQTPCFAVVADISQYSDTEFEDVFNQADEKWYKLNNLSAYEEYGVYGSGRNITYYNGKLTIDDGYEYQYSGNTWVNVGEVSGSSRVPQGYVELEWAEVPQGYFSNFKVPYDFQTYYKYSIDFTPLDFYNSSYYGGIFGAPTVGYTNDLFFMKMDNGWGDEYYRLELHLHGYTLDTRDGFSDMSGKFAVFDGVRAKISLNLSGYTTGQGAEITVENEGMSTFTGVGTTTLGSYSPTYGVQNIYMFGTGNYDYGKTVSMKFHDFKVETSGGTAVYDYIPVKRQSDNAVGIYDIVNNTFNVPSDFTLIAGSAASGGTEYPIYYDTIQDPPNNVTFTSMTEAEEYECPWVGMKATIDGSGYTFSGDSQSGYEWVHNSSRLPVGYTEVQYIENTDYASLEINYHPNQDTRIIAEMQATSGNENIYGRFFGSGHWNCEDGTHGWQFDYEENPTGQLHISWGARCGWNTYNVYGDYNVHTYDWNKNEFYIDNTLVASATYQNFTCETNLGIFAQILGTGEPPSINGDGYKEYLRGKLYDFKIYDDGTLVADLVPCVDPNNVAGVYDIINNVFYTAVNQGYTFVAGPAVN